MKRGGIVETIGIKGAESPTGVKGFVGGHAIADSDYGVLGPQSAANGVAV